MRGETAHHISPIPSPARRLWDSHDYAHICAADRESSGKLGLGGKGLERAPRRNYPAFVFETQGVRDGLVRRNIGDETVPCD